MEREQIDKIIDVAKANQAIYRQLLKRPQAAAQQLGVVLRPADIDALRLGEASIRQLARAHDDRQGHDSKSCLFMPILASVPSKRKRKAPKAPKRPKRP